jgi:hypothetical protein
MVEKAEPEEAYICYWRNMAYESRLNITTVLGTSNSGFRD